MFSIPWLADAVARVGPTTTISKHDFSFSKTCYSESIFLVFFEPRAVYLQQLQNISKKPHQDVLTVRAEETTMGIKHLLIYACQVLIEHCAGHSLLAYCKVVETLG